MADEAKNLVEVDIDSLAGAALAWAVCAANGYSAKVTRGRHGPEVVYYDEGHGSWSTVRLDDIEVAQAMDKHLVGVERPGYGQKPPVWRALADYRGKTLPFRSVYVVSARSTDRSTAIFRAVVKSVFDDKVSIPKELLQETVETS